MHKSAARLTSPLSAAGSKNQKGAGELEHRHRLGCLLLETSGQKNPSRTQREQRRAPMWGGDRSRRRRRGWGARPSGRSRTPGRRRSSAANAGCHRSLVRTAKRSTGLPSSPTNPARAAAQPLHVGTTRSHGCCVGRWVRRERLVISGGALVQASAAATRGSP